jgi:hypothetical protein
MTSRSGNKLMVAFKRVAKSGGHHIFSAAGPSFPRLPFTLIALGLLLLGGPMRRADAQTARTVIDAVLSLSAAQEITGPDVRLFDTQVPASAALSAAAFAEKANWSRVPEETLGHEFKGDAVVMNDKIAIVLRRRDHGATLYSLGPDGAQLRAELVPISGTLTGHLTALTIEENGPGTVSLRAAYLTDSDKECVLGLELALGQPFVKTQSVEGVRGLRVAAPSRFAVLPDFFADDIVVDATKLPMAKAELPSEHFLLNMLDDGNAILMSVWDVADRDVEADLQGEGAARRITGTQIQYGKEGQIWVAVIAEPNIWHLRDVASNEAGEVLELDWKAPFPAHWRVDWQRDGDLTSSWEMIAQKPDGSYVKSGWLGQPESFGNPDWMKPNRGRWTTVLGSFQYPCWLDRSARGYLQPLKKVFHFQGPALVYPIGRVAASPLDRFTVVDIMRGTLGVGPCEYILDVEGQKKHFHGAATCATRTTLNAIYAQKQQKERRADVDQALLDVMAFITHIRVRIDDYATFGREMAAYLTQEKAAHPELTQPIDALRQLAEVIDTRVARRKNKIKSVAFANSLAERFRTTLVDYDGGDALAKCKEITSAWVQIGGNQDELVGECRVAVKVLRQRAALVMAQDPRMAEISREVRRRTQVMLRNPTSYEAPRH